MTPRPVTCRSHRKYGRCGLPSGHDGDHAVPVGDDVWFIYSRQRRRNDAIGHRQGAPA